MKAQCSVIDHLSNKDTNLTVDCSTAQSSFYLAKLIECVWPVSVKMSLQSDEKQQHNGGSKDVLTAERCV